MLLLRVVRPGVGGLFRLFGELDSSNVSELDNVLRRARGGGDIVLDLTDLTFIDSSGIKGFIQIARELGTGANLVLLSPRPSVARVLELTRIAEVLPNVIVLLTHDDSFGRERHGAKRGGRAATSAADPVVIAHEPRPAAAVCPSAAHGGSGDEALPFIWLG
jgi:anti-sigma B factor antagonist